MAPRYTRLEAMFMTSDRPASPTFEENELDFLSGTGSDLRIGSHE